MSFTHKRLPCLRLSPTNIQEKKAAKYEQVHSERESRNECKGTDQKELKYKPTTDHQFPGKWFIFGTREGIRVLRALRLRSSNHPAQMKFEI